MNKIPMNFLAVILLFFSHSVMALKIPENARASIPAPKIKAKSWVLMDHNSGWILAAKNPDLRIEPASLSKLMTTYVVFGELKSGKLKLTDTAHVSEKAWRTIGSRMFIRVNTKVTIENLLKGLIIQSGNDAAVALAEHVAGSEENFAQLMNQAAAKLGLKNSNYVNSTGLPNKKHYSTAYDVSLLSSALIREFPEFYKWYSIKKFTYNGISQHNRNNLLWRDPAVDGIKTGHTDAAGFCLVGSAFKENMRLIAAVTGTSSSGARTRAVSSLLKYGYANYESHLLYAEAKPAVEVEVFKGERDIVPVGIGRDLFVTLPRGTFKKLKADLSVNEAHIAPVTKTQEMGSLKLSLAGKPISEYPLVALDEIPEGAWWQRLVDTVRLWIR